MNVSTTKFLFGFTILCIIYRILLPAGDEPDYEVRSAQLLNLYVYSPFSPYKYLSYFVEGIVVEQGCLIDSRPLSFWAHVDSTTCAESFENIVARTSLTILVTSPLIIFVICRKAFANKISKLMGVNKNSLEYIFKIEAIALSLLTPSVMYYIGLFSHEQFFVVISFFIFLFYRSIFALALVLILMFLTDTGNSLVVVFFLLFSWLFWSLRFVGFKFLIFTSLVAVAVAAQGGFILLDSLPIFQERSQAIIEAYRNKNDIITKYPIVLRPVITFMGFVFTTPASLKIIPAYIIVIMVIARYLQLLKKRPRDGDGILMHDVFLWSGCCTVLTFVFLLPTYANAKYYIFLMPFIIYSLLLTFGQKKVLSTIVILNLVVLINLGLFRL